MNYQDGGGFPQWQNEQSPQKFNQMLSRGGGSPYRPQGVTPPGPNHSLDWSAGGGQELSKGGDPSGMWPHKWKGQMERPGGGMGRPPDVTPPGPNHSLDWSAGGGQELTKPTDRPMAYGYARPGGGELGPQGPYTPMGEMGPKGGPMGDPRFPQGPIQAPYTGGQMSPMQRSLLAQRFRMGSMPPPPRGPQLPAENPIYPNPVQYPDTAGNQYGIDPFQWRT